MDRGASMVGRVLSGKWRVERLLGEGGSSIVYAAAHRNGRCVAIKVLRDELAQKPKARKRFLREGYLANQVKHPGAVAVLDDDVDDDGTVFLVMELLEGETLARKNSRRSDRLALSGVLSVADQVLDVLTAAHASGIIHRDVKPENVFISRDGTIKLLDFGIARLCDPRTNAAASSFTGTDAAMGTLGFMAPEQARGRFRDVDARTDVWAVGALLFRCLTGRLVHSGETPNELLIASATQPAPPIGSFAPDVPPEVALVIDRALYIDKQDRWQSARSMQEALRAVRGELELTLPALSAEHDGAESTDPGAAPLWAGSTIDASQTSGVAPRSSGFGRNMGRFREWSFSSARRWFLAAALVSAVLSVSLLTGRSHRDPPLGRRHDLQKPAEHVSNAARAVDTVLPRAPLDPATAVKVTLEQPSDIGSVAATSPPAASPRPPRLRQPPTPSAARTAAAAPAAETLAAPGDIERGRLSDDEILDQRE
jgi:serine/threonine-protein kinase